MFHIDHTRTPAFRAPLIVLIVLAALSAGVFGAINSASGAPTPTTVTLGSTTGSGTEQNICVAMIDCTYVPFTNVADASLVAPFNGTVTSFSINSGSSAGTVHLRVLRPGAGGTFTGVGASPAETLTGGLNSFTVSLPVQSGDVLGLDNDSSALLFDTSSLTPLTAYYETPSLVDGAPASAPNHTMMGFRLLLSAVVQSSTTTTSSGVTASSSVTTSSSVSSTSTSTSTSTSSTSTTTSSATASPPVISGARLTHTRFRVAARGTAVSAVALPRGTSFQFGLSASARLSIAITHTTPGVLHGRRCGALSRAIKRAGGHACRRTVTIATLTRASEPAGADTVAFSGRIGRRALAAGRYRAALSARNAAGRSQTVTLAFSVVR